MSYLVLARKWRPKMFKELVGQEILSQTLRNAVTYNRVAQAFLFCGSRGTGKTSCARILAKALACQNPTEGEPCGVCKNCQIIEQGGSADIIEIDAASNRGIENIRKIREDLAYLPIQNKFKVFIIDEAHMLTVESFNALLKSLEEPPAHVKFILATTEPQKIPQTIQSRCQRYEFHNIDTEKIATHLVYIAQQEGMEISNSNLKKIAKNAAGAMREALTSLDMLLAFCGKQIKDEDLSQILEMTESKDLEELLSAIIEQDITAALIFFKNLCNKGIPLQIILSDFLLLVHKISLLKSCPQSNTNEPIQSDTLQKKLELTPLSKLQQYFQILLEVEQQGKTSQFPMLCIEMGIIKMCSVESLARVQDILHQLEKNTINYEPIQSQNFSREVQKAVKTSTVTEQTASVSEPAAEQTVSVSEPTAEQTVSVSEPTTEPTAEQTVSVSEPTTELTPESMPASNFMPDATVQQINKKIEPTNPADWQNQNPQTTKMTAPIKNLNFENYKKFVAELKNQYPSSYKIKQLQQLQLQKIIDKKLILASDESLSFWTNEYQIELENYLERFFGEKIEVSLLLNEPEEKIEPEKIEPEKTEPEKIEPEKIEPEKTETEKTEKLSEDIVVRTAQEIFKA